MTGRCSRASSRSTPTPAPTDGKRSDDYGTLRLLELPKDSQVKGPGQVQNDIGSLQRDVARRSALTLSQFLNNAPAEGSRVTLGNLLTLPVGGGLLYVQPIYVRASGDSAFPLSAGHRGGVRRQAGLVRHPRRRARRPVRRQLRRHRGRLRQLDARRQAPRRRRGRPPRRPARRRGGAAPRRSPTSRPPTTRPEGAQGTATSRHTARRRSSSTTRSAGRGGGAQGRLGDRDADAVARRTTPTPITTTPDGRCGATDGSGGRVGRFGSGVRRSRKVVSTDAGWSSSVARRAHNPEVAGSNPAPATRSSRSEAPSNPEGASCCRGYPDA